MIFFWYILCTKLGTAASTPAIWWRRPATTASTTPRGSTSWCRPILFPHDHCQLNLINRRSRWGRPLCSFFCHCCQFEPKAKPPPSTRVVLMVGEVMGLSRSLPRFSWWGWWRGWRWWGWYGWWLDRWSLSLQVRVHKQEWFCPLQLFLVILKS